MKTLDFEVTQADIDAGVPGDCYSCPIWLALRRVVSERVSIAVKSRWVALSHGAFTLTVDLPTPARLFVCAFDKIKREKTEEDRGFIRPFKSSLRFEDEQRAQLFGEEGS